MLAREPDGLGPRPRAVRPESGKESSVTPRKVRELVAELERAGFVNRGGKGGQRNVVHPLVKKPVTITGRLGDGARLYQERAVRLAIDESNR